MNRKPLSRGVNPRRATITSEIHPRNAYCLAPLTDDTSGPLCGKHGTEQRVVSGLVCVLCPEHAKEIDEDEEDDDDPATLCPSSTKRLPEYAHPATPELFPTLFDHDVPRLRKLIAEGADVNALDEHGQTPALLAVCLEDVKLLTVLRDAGANLLARNTLGQTTLQFAAGDGPIEILKMVLAAGADPDDQRDRYRRTALHLAAIRNRSHAATLLLEAGARVDLRDWEDQTPLMGAAANGSLDAARVILPRCAPSDRDEALLVAAGSASLAMVKLLLGAGADPGYVSPGGDTALKVAWKKNAKVVKLLSAAHVRESRRAST
jgi:Ankyrin repeats (3 copies)